MTALSPAAQLERLRRGTVEIVTEEALLAKLAEGRPLRVKLGLDPTAPDLHIGNAIVLQKLRQFQDLGHEAVLIIGDFTGLIGDPSGKSETRPSLTPQEIERNAETYREQYSRILDPHRTRVVFNSQWLGAMKFYDVIKLAARTTVHRILERDDFAKRYAERLPIHLHELLYPLCQAYDSVAIQADVELGGTDQKFNNLMGRDLQREVGQAPQAVVLTPLLPGLDGVQKMSKSLGNAIGITDPPNEMYGKVMSLPDPLMIPYFEYCTLVPLDEIRALESSLGSGRAHPRDAKRRLAREITARYHGEPAAGAAETGCWCRSGAAGSPASGSASNPARVDSWSARYAARSMGGAGPACGVLPVGASADHGPGGAAAARAYRPPLQRHRGVERRPLRLDRAELRPVRPAHAAQRNGAGSHLLSGGPLADVGGLQALRPERVGRAPADRRVRDRRDSAGGHVDPAALPQRTDRLDRRGLRRDRPGDRLLRPECPARHSHHLLRPGRCGGAVAVRR